MKKTIFALILVFCMLFAACQTNDAEKTNANDENTLDSIETDTAEEDYNNLPVFQNTYDGETVDILMGSFAWVDMYTPDGLNGEVLNDAIYNRNLAVETKLNVKLNIIFINDERDGSGDMVTSKFTAALRSGDKIYDIYMASQVVMTHAARERYLINFDYLPWIDLTKPWWDTNSTDSLNFGGKVFFGVNDINYSNLGMTCVLLFNKNLFKNEGIPYPYDLVKSGGWTYEEFAKIVQSASKDINGDGIIDIKDDQFGFSGWQWEVGPNLYTALGASFVTKDKDNMPSLTINSARSYSAFEMIVDLFNNGGAYHNHTMNVWLDRDRFADGYILMTDYRSYYLDYFQDMSDNFGIIPHPKFDKNQEGYRQLVSGVGTYTAIPIICKEPVLASAVVEALASESYKTVRPQYYETILQTKYTRDGESAEMIEIIAKNRVYSVWLDTFGTLDVFSSMIAKGDANLASFYARNETKALAEIDKMIEIYSYD
ncbi:MAG: extracellular solute-binding protein [Oscillospiraceae bacterium]|nr:extracellular solute-binding protein [Oscillospiraceae bacterium]